MEVNAAACHELLKKTIKQKLAYRDDCDYTEWKKQIKEKYDELLGINEIRKNECPLNLVIESAEYMDGYRRIRFTYESEVGAVVPAYILIPNTGKEKYPVVITLQGHSSGFHNSVSIAKSERDKNYIKTQGAYTTQAVKQGYIGVAIEQRAMGERRPEDPGRSGALMCGHEAHVAEMLGRTLLGERAWDISKLIDALASFPECDLDKIVLTGSSGGGTATYYSACFDERIKIAAPDCSFCAYEDSIMNFHHCSCNYIPHAYEWFEMQDLACLIAPRNLICMNGGLDEVFPPEGVKKAYRTVEKIYAREHATGNCRLSFSTKGHYWCQNLVWPAIREEMLKLGWLDE